MRHNLLSLRRATILRFKETLIRISIKIFEETNEFNKERIASRERSNDAYENRRQRFELVKNRHRANYISVS